MISKIWLMRYAQKIPEVNRTYSVFYGVNDLIYFFLKIVIQTVQVIQPLLSITVIAVPLLYHCNTSKMESVRGWILENKKDKPTENTIGKAGRPALSPFPIHGVICQL